LELAEFYAHDLGELLGVPVEGFDVYVREDKSVLDDERLLELTRALFKSLVLLSLGLCERGK